MANYNRILTRTPAKQFRPKTMTNGPLGIGSGGDFIKLQFNDNREISRKYRYTADITTNDIYRMIGAVRMEVYANRLTPEEWQQFIRLATKALT